jgi:hypothetical protein
MQSLDHIPVHTRDHVLSLLQRGWKLRHSVRGAYVEEGVTALKINETIFLALRNGEEIKCVETLPPERGVRRNAEYVYVGN